MTKRGEVHISDDQLLLYVDEELASRDAQRVHAHLASCWSCRARQDELNTAINTLVRFRNDVMLPAIPPPDNWPGLEPKLKEIDNREPSGLLAGRFRFASLHKFIAPLWKPIAIGNLAVLAAVIIFFYMYNRYTPIVSAAELLHRAAVSELQVQRNVTKPVVHQKLRIQVGQRSFTRNIYRDTAGKRQVERLENTPADQSAILAPIQKAFQASNLDWEAPLSPNGYSHWLSTLRVGNEQVVEVGDATEIRASTPQGAIRSATLKLRNSDLHPVAGEYELQDNGRVEIAELSYSVVSLDQLNADIFSTTPAIHFKPAIPVLNAAPAPKIPETSSVVEPLSLEELEIDALDRLDRMDALMNDQLRVVRTADGLVSIEGVVESDQRRDALIEALGPIAQNPRVKLALTTIAESEARLRDSKAPVLRIQTIDLPVNPGNPILRRYLSTTKHLSGAELEREMGRFSATAVDHSIQAQLHALTIKQILNSLSPADTNAASSKARQQWRALVTRHLQAAQRELAALRDLLSGAFGTPQRERSGKETTQTDMKAAIARVCELTGVTDQVLWKALTPPEGSEPIDLGKDEKFWETFDTSEKLVISILEQVSKTDIP